MAKVSLRMASVSRESVFVVQTTTARRQTTTQQNEIDHGPSRTQAPKLLLGVSDRRTTTGMELMDQSNRPE